MLRATLNEPVPLQMGASDGRTDLFGRAIVVRASGATIVTLALPHVGSGVYGVNYTPTTEEFLAVVFQFFLDSGFTQPAPYDVQYESVEVNSDKINVMRILGLLHENAVMDQQAYDSDGNLLQARLQVYDTKSHAQTQNPAGLLYAYTVKGTYASGLLSRWSIERDS